MIVCEGIMIPYKECVFVTITDVCLWSQIGSSCTDMRKINVNLIRYPSIHVRLINISHVIECVCSRLRNFRS